MGGRSGGTDGARAAAVVFGGPPQTALAVRCERRGDTKANKTSEGLEGHHN